MNQNSPQDLPFTDKIWKNFSRRIDYKTITVSLWEQFFRSFIYLFFRSKILNNLCYISPWLTKIPLGSSSSRLMGHVCDIENNLLECLQSHYCICYDSSCTCHIYNTLPRAGLHIFFCVSFLQIDIIEGPLRYHE